MIGKSIAHYAITAKLGEGGMGEVYRATDARLGRDVAIKLLPAAVAQDPSRLARFRREAQVLASLTHGNIAQVYGLEEYEGQHAIVLELVEGEDLAERLQRGPLALDDAREVARQIAEALEAAHEKGIVHRDLKPANVKLAPGGSVKVLDFGLAKALAPDTSSGSGVNLTASPTVTSAQTRDGVILGTAAYMAPEQARGREVDKRADIWAYGCVLYEMLTGETAFAADTVSDTLVSVLTGEVDWTLLPAGTPAAVRRLLERCLTRDVRRRLRDIGEARVALEDLSTGASGDVAPVPAAATPDKASPARWIALGLLGAALFAAGWLLRPSSGTGEPLPDYRVRRVTFESGLEQEPTLSPDGNYVAYTTDRAGNLDIEILPLTGGNVTRITDHPADDAQPRWSPDGTRLAFVSARERENGLLVMSGNLGASSVYVSSEGGDIFLMPALGGPATKLIDDATYPSWSPDGREIAFLSTRDGYWRIWKVAVTGGQPVQLTHGEETRFDFQPAWSPDGRWIAYGMNDSGGNREGLYVVPAAGGEPVRVCGDDAIAPAWSLDGKYLYFSSSRSASPGMLNLWRIRFDLDARPAPRPERFTLGVNSDAYAAPGDRRVGFSTVRFSPDIWQLDVASGKLEQITTLEGLEDYPHLNPDGRHLVFDGDRSGTQQLWVLDLTSGELQQVPTPGRSGLARWSPDGTMLAYQLSTSDEVEVIGGSPAVRVAIQRWGDANATIIDGEAGRASTGLAWSPDGKQLAGNNADDVWLHTPGGESKLWIENANFPTWSPDGSEVAFQRNAGRDHREIWVVPAGGGEERMIAGGAVHLSHPQWHPADHDRILVVIDHQDLGIVRVGDGSVERITDLASSTILVDYPSWSPDGKSIYFSYAQKRGDIYMIEEVDEAGAASP